VQRDKLKFTRHKNKHQVAMQCEEEEKISHFRINANIKSLEKNSSTFTPQRVSKSPL